MAVEVRKVIRQRHVFCGPSVIGSEDSTNIVGACHHAFIVLNCIVL